MLGLLTLAVFLTLLAEPSIAHSQHPTSNLAHSLAAVEDHGAARGHLHEHGPASSEEALRIWLKALSHLQAGQPRAAIPHLEQLVSTAPGEARFRYALARALYEVEDDERAQFHFNQALGGELSERERVIAERYLDRIELRKDWRAGFHVALVPESNPLKRTAAETINIGGLDFVLDPDARAEAGTGLKFRGSFSWTPSINHDVKARLSILVNGTLYRENDYNDIALRTEAGFIHLRDGGTQMGAGLTYQHRELWRKTYYFGPGAYVSYQQRVGRRTGLSLRADYANLTYPSRLNQDSVSMAGNVRMSHVVTAQFAIHASMFLARAKAEAASQSGTERGVALGGQYLFEGGLITSLDVTRSWQDRDARSGLFVDPRKDDRWSLTARIRHRDLTLRGLAPTLELTYEVQDSSIPLYEYRNKGVAFGLSRDF